MQQFINEVILWLQEFVNNCPYVLSIFAGMLVIILESIIPMLPLGVFIALNMLLYGNALGFILSWIATSIGCLLSFYLVRRIFNKRFEDKTKDNKKILGLMKKINKLPFSSFVLITALPFTPAFAINIAAGLSKMSIKKFILGILVAKLFIIYFWGFIGTTFLQSVTDISVLIELALMLLAAYVISKLIMKKYKLD